MPANLSEIIAISGSFPLAVYQYGSRVYGTISQKSDWDYIVISERHAEKIDLHRDSDLNLTIYPVQLFQEELNNHEISALECYFLPKNNVTYVRHEFDFKLDLVKLRHSISKKVSHSWVKAKKKLTVDKDYDLYTGKKSLFHSLRILDFGIQLAKFGSIQNYESVNDLYLEILNGPDDWASLDSIWRPLKNGRLTEFRFLTEK